MRWASLTAWDSHLQSKRQSPRSIAVAIPAPVPSRRPRQFGATLVFKALHRTSRRMLMRRCSSGLSHLVRCGERALTDNDRSNDCELLSHALLELQPPITAIGRTSRHNTAPLIRGGDISLMYLYRGDRVLMSKVSTSGWVGIRTWAIWC